MNELIRRLNRAIDLDYDAKNAEVDDLLTIPFEDLVVKGEIISQVTAHFSGSQTAEGYILFNKVSITCPDNSSKFREGSPVCLQGNGYKWNLELIADNGEQMDLEIGFDIESIPCDLNDSTGWQIRPAKVDIRNIVKKSTVLLENNPEKLSRISDIFNGDLLPSFSKERQASAKSIVEKTNLNPAQKLAFINAYSAESYYLIQGPPGTGKTWLLAHLAIEFAKEGKKVLVTANTHPAISNALQKASVLSGYPHIIKVGKTFQKESLNDNGSEARNTTDLRQTGYTNESRGIIVGATCYAPYTKKLEFMDWDVVIIDEAGQLTVPLAIAAMAKSDIYILIGDHMQLAPIQSDKIKDPEFKGSIFEHLFKFSPGTMLDVTYRMNKEINAFPGKQFYSDLLKPHPGNENRRLSIPNNFRQYQEILDRDKPEVLLCHHHPSDHSRSEFEAETVASFVQEFLDQGISPDSIAVITPFRAQVRLIRKKLARLTDYNSFKSRLFVDTIERIQGQERDIIMYSLSVSDPEKAKIRAEFFYSPNRLNVAITRAKMKRIVIGNRLLFKEFPEDGLLNALSANFRDFYKSSTIVTVDPENDDLF